MYLLFEVYTARNSAEMGKVVKSCLLIAHMQKGGALKPLPRNAEVVVGRSSPALN